eukprot:TRINITY_DN92568_c0_g1_i2.p1 TRINITY_DN92568_c0_g1~~TRINITY_DN92568_c0_g1_i2.p1  ORF type:complete len:240 (+),score=35.19 TRINITY_DN92568_c0_g1_i2:519-1238(+)
MILALLEGTRREDARRLFETGTSLQKAGRRLALWTDPMQFPPRFLPGLRSQAVWNTAALDIAKLLEAHFEPILEDYRRIPENAWRLEYDGDLISDGSWAEFEVFNGSAWRNCDVASATCALLRNRTELQGQISQPGLEDIAMQVSFLRLYPRSRLRLHTGRHNARLTLHLPLHVLGSAGLAVAEEVLSWKEGKALVFDDSYAHKAWNDGEESRTVLYATMWHPDLVTAGFKTKLAHAEL